MHRARPRSKPLLVTVLALLALLAGVAAGHEGHEHTRPAPVGPVDPQSTYPYGLVAAGGGHFHALLIMPGLTPIFAGTHIGLFRSEDRGRTWRLAAARFGGDDVHGLARDPRTGALYAATHGQGLLVSPDGVRWRDDSAGLPGRDLHALALDPVSGAVYVWAVGHGLFRRDADGRTWRKLAGLDALSDVESLAVNPATPERLYAGTAKGVPVSADGGRHWQLPPGGLTRRSAGVAVSPKDPVRVFAATLDGVFVGAADGTRWLPLPPAPSWWGPLDGFAFLESQPERLFAVAHDGVVAERSLTEGDWQPLALEPR